MKWVLLGFLTALLLASALFTLGYEAASYSNHSVNSCPLVRSPK